MKVSNRIEHILIGSRAKDCHGRDLDIDITSRVFPESFEHCIRYCETGHFKSETI